MHARRYREYRITPLVPQLVVRVKHSESRRKTALPHAVGGIRLVSTPGSGKDCDSGNERCGANDSSQWAESI